MHAIEFQHNITPCLLYSGIDYHVNNTNAKSRRFTVCFHSKQVQSSEHVIQIADDDIYERREYFRLRVHTVSFIGQAGMLFTAQNGVNNTYVDVSIEDNDGKS